MKERKYQPSNMDLTRGVCTGKKCDAHILGNFEMIFETIYYPS